MPLTLFFTRSSVKWLMVPEKFARGQKMGSAFRRAPMEQRENAVTKVPPQYVRPARNSVDDAERAFWRKRTIGGPVKRLFDILGASIAIVFLSPVFLPVALIIKILDRGPIFYSHKRIGRGGKTFWCLKFRTMVIDAQQRLEEHLVQDRMAAQEWRRTRKLVNDPRITRFGSFLRQCSVDELPQLINVLIGDMSLVGPRPVVEEELVNYGLRRIHYLSARPGLTGAWQVGGRSRSRYAQRVMIDADYALHWSFFRDISICLRTVPAVLSRRGAY